MAVRTRKNVATLGKTGDDLDWYGKAVGELRKRPLNDPTSWRYQAAVHGYPGHANDPFGKAGEALPSVADRNRFWDQCQHQTWFFLPWHRGYLACFEEIIASAVVQLGGPKDWALPYWNYSASSAARSLPGQFLKRIKASKKNPLWSAGRNMTSSTDRVPASHVALGALTHSPFDGSASGGDPGFGGPSTAFSHFGGANGRLESTPHNLVHVDVGGLMQDPDTAALDPIFWLHHANIDRLWEVWLHRNPTFTNPTSAAWLTGVNFLLHDSAGNVVQFNSSQMRDPTKVRHGYKYDDISDPFATAPAVAAASATRMVTKAPAPALVAASKPSIALGKRPTSARISFQQPARMAAVARAGGARPVRAFLNIENVTGTGVHGNYEVYIDAPATDEASRKRKPLLAGHLSTFGVSKASSKKAPHGGSGITSVLEITPLIEQLHRDRNWDGAHLDVTFVPEESVRGAAADKLTVGRISVYYS